jgi:hypothetical protein
MVGAFLRGYAKSPNWWGYWYQSMLPSPPYITANNVYVSVAATNYFGGTRTGNDDYADLVRGPTDQQFSSRAAAGFAPAPALPVPASCTAPIGNVSVP